MQRKPRRNQDVIALMLRQAKSVRRVVIRSVDWSAIKLKQNAAGVWFLVNPQGRLPR